MIASRENVYSQKRMSQWLENGSRGCWLWGSVPWVPPVPQVWEMVCTFHFAHWAFVQILWGGGLEEVNKMVTGVQATNIFFFNFLNAKWLYSIFLIHSLFPLLWLPMDTSPWLRNFRWVSWNKVGGEKQFAKGNLVHQIHLQSIVFSQVTCLASAAAGFGPGSWKLNTSMVQKLFSSLALASYLQWSQ